MNSEQKGLLKIKMKWKRWINKKNQKDLFQICKKPRENTPINGEGQKFVAEKGDGN